MLMLGSVCFVVWGVMSEEFAKNRYLGKLSQDRLFCLVDYFLARKIHGQFIMHI